MELISEKWEMMHVAPHWNLQCSLIKIGIVLHLLREEIIYNNQGSDQSQNVEN